MPDYTHDPDRPTYENLDTGERRQVLRNSAEHRALVSERYRGQSHLALWVQIPDQRDQPKETDDA